MDFQDSLIIFFDLELFQIVMLLPQIHNEQLNDFKNHFILLEGKHDLNLKFSALQKRDLSY